MRRYCLFFAIVLGSALPASAQEAPKRWDVGVTAGLASFHMPSEFNHNDWMFEGRYAVSLGRYWSEHLKTEVEFATTSKASRFTHKYANVPGVPELYPYSYYEDFRLHQTSARIVWQFLDNAWVHPYVFGGVTLDALQTDTFVPEQFYYPDPRNPATRIRMTPQIDEEGEIAIRAGGIAGAGAKIYVTKNAFFNAAFVATYAKPTRTVGLIGGFGVDF